MSNGIPGVEIVSSPLALAAKMQPSDDQIRQVLSFARPNYDWTLVDLGRSLSRIAMAAMEEIDEVCLVTTLEVPALHQAKQIVQTLLDGGLRQIAHAAAAQPRAQAPGHFDRRARKDAGHSHFRHRSPNDYPELYETYAEGRMLNRSSDLGKQIARLALKLATIEDEKTEKKRFALFG